MRRSIMGWFVISALGAGCGASSPPPGGTTPVEQAQQERAELERLQREADQRDAEMRELRSRLALARAEADDLREREPAPAVRRETVRIRSEDGAARNVGSQSSEDALEYFDDEGSEWDTPSTELPDREPARTRREEPRPVLRLYGTPQTPLPEAMLRAPELPSAGTVPAGLAASMAPPLAPIPMAGARVNPNAADIAYASVAPIPLAPPQPSRPMADGVTALYRGALGDLRARRFAQALDGFDRILNESGSHHLAASARYWRAEVLYIQRRYRDALAGFQAYLRRHADGSKAPDALLKVSLCRRRMGDRAGAQRALEQLRRDYPTSIAARTLMREDAT